VCNCVVDDAMTSPEFMVDGEWANRGVRSQPHTAVYTLVCAVSDGFAYIDACDVRSEYHEVTACVWSPQDMVYMAGQKNLVRVCTAKKDARCATGAWGSESRDVVRTSGMPRGVVYTLARVHN
jgi:hypothetical protein